MEITRNSVLYLKFNSNIIAKSISTNLVMAFICSCRLMFPIGTTSGAVNKLLISSNQNVDSYYS